MNSISQALLEDIKSYITVGLVEKKIREAETLEELLNYEREIATRKEILKIMEKYEEIERIKNYFKIGKRLDAEDIKNITVGDKFYYFDTELNKIGAIQIQEYSIHNTVRSIEKFYKFEFIKISSFNDYILIYGPMKSIQTYFVGGRSTHKESDLLSLPLYFDEDNQKKILFSKKK